jgi:hypothetical protein
MQYPTLTEYDIEIAPQKEQVLFIIASAVHLLIVASCHAAIASHFICFIRSIRLPH